MTKSGSSVVLDSYAVLAFLFEEPGGEAVRVLLKSAADTGARHLITAVNWAEVRNAVERMRGSFRSWELTKQELEQLPLEVVSTDKALAEQAGQFKARGGVSLADCFAAALAQREGAFLCTGDPEFKRLEKDIRINWI
ncbi:MAG: type II toxin-antitoxin system VapC family toxin [Candidatus Omnitrophica bacterium]|nr:type II toxin-antitoxin system VapC family toxin [Candidatus Omnitrophota bacterium]